MANKKKKAARGDNADGASKSDFIRANPDLSAADLLAKAKSSGMSLSSVLIYKVRSRAKTKSTGRTSARATGGMSASAFVRSLPASMKAADVVSAAKAKGITLSTTLVYMVRSVERRKQGLGKAPTGARGARGAASSIGTSGDVSAFKKLALNLGIAKAREALNELERGLAALLG